MKLYTQKFLGEENEYAGWEEARYVILPVPYEGAVSYGRGAAGAPDAVLEASCYLEFYDEVLGFCPHRAGIAVAAPLAISDDHREMHERIYHRTAEILWEKKIPVVLGGDHSISSGVFRAFKEHYGTLSCIQFDAHADLRPEYQGSRFSHASVMARIREMTPHTLQIGIRSLSEEEARLIDEQRLSVIFMHNLRRGKVDLDAALAELPDPVFITFDVDAFDWSVISSTGTPEPGGLLWDETVAMLSRIFAAKNVVGFDVVELAVETHDRNSPFAVAKLIYRMIGLSIAAGR
ncbi:MAG: agmatinase [candidate division KSB1 bacterium]|nr:agmatinase [candidate division KSB1 bacterium]